MQEFIPGRELCRLFFEDAVRPILDCEFPRLRYSAARIDTGSEILGFDTEMSMDHDWGPRLQLFLEDSPSPVRSHGPGSAAAETAGAFSSPSCNPIAESIQEALTRSLPPIFRGFPTGYSRHPDGTRKLDSSEPGAVRHAVQTLTVSDYFRDYLDFDIARDIEPADWLTFPEQKLLTITTGPIYHDGTGLAAARDRFHYYPRDVWIYLLAAAWNRIGQDEHLMGRAGIVGDELGSSIIASRLVRDLMRLCFLIERRYAPYAKWLGTAFMRLSCGPRMTRLLTAVQRAATWQERDAALAPAYEAAAEMQNSLRLTAPLGTTPGPFYKRPFLVIHLGANFADALCGEIQDPAVKMIAQGRLIGSIDLLSDNTDLLCGTEWRSTIRSLYEPPHTKAV